MLCFDLALELGMTVEHLLTGKQQPLSHKELIEWAIYRRHKPFGADIDDFRFGIQQALFVNANKDPKKKAAKAEDFMMAHKTQTVVSEPEQQKNIFKALAVITKGM